jgi:hypothetical protein
MIQEQLRIAGQKVPARRGADPDGGGSQTQRPGVVALTKRSLGKIEQGRRSACRCGRLYPQTRQNVAVQLGWAWKISGDGEGPNTPIYANMPPHLQAMHDYFMSINARSIQRYLVDPGGADIGMVYDPTEGTMKITMAEQTYEYVCVKQ